MFIYVTLGGAIVSLVLSFIIKEDLRRLKYSNKQADEQKVSKTDEDAEVSVFSPVDRQ